MRKLNRLLILLMALGVTGSTANAQYRLNLTGSGARASAMGYAFTAIADDATAISWNAAGLTQLLSPEASIIGRVSAGSKAIEGADYKVDRASDFNLNFASFVLPLSMGAGNLVAGIAYRNIFDFNNNITYTWPLTDDKMTDKNKGGVWGISPSAAMQLTPNFSVGGTFNILTGSSEHSIDRNDVNYIPPSKEDYSGTSLEIGVLAGFNQLSVGANFKLPYTLKIKNEKEETDIKIPAFFSVGTALHVSDNLTLAFDYQARPWSKATVSSGGKDVNLGFENVNSIHLGMEFVVPFGGLAIPLRLGFYTAPKPWKDDEDNKISGTMFTLGSGLALGKLSLNASLELGGSTYQSSYYSGNETVMGNTTDVDVRMTLGATLGL